MNGQIRLNYFAVTAFLLILYFLLPFKIEAVTPIPHYTVILNQVRGSECCDRGDFERFLFQHTALKKTGLVGNFAIRFDALKNNQYLSVISTDSVNEYGALLEITPELAKASNVTYRSDVSKWYEAQNVYLIGYNQEERKKLIDTYMDTYQKSLGELPKFSSSWMIDPWSLSYLKETYGVVAHQITREQFGTDSYTLYGGPVNYPYYPSRNWALIPAENSTMPLIMRQTISDPVFNYGDKSSSHTSQPNDYFIRNDSINYFRHLFFQAHDQPNGYTFALIGLENSMTMEVQREYEKQLEVVREWQIADKQNQALRVSDFESWRSKQGNGETTIYGGAPSNDNREKAWWIGTLRYRARLILSGGELAITDLRIYHPDFTDPYLTSTAQSSGWWIVPFVLDGSRFFDKGSDGIVLNNDLLTNRQIEDSTRIVIGAAIDKVVVEREGSSFRIKGDASDLVLFEPNRIELLNNQKVTVTGLLPKPLTELTWETEKGGKKWGFKKIGQTLTPFVANADLTEDRARYKDLLFPEKKFEVMDQKLTTLLVNNYYSIANRNPIRAVLFPKNKEGKDILLARYPKASANPPVQDISIHEQHQGNGTVFIDFASQKPIKTAITINYDGFQKTAVVYFAPNCKQEALYCITHPIQAWWYIRSYIGDKFRELDEKKQKEAQSVN